MDPNSNSEGPIGFVKPALTGVKVGKKQAVLGGSQLVGPAPKALAGPVRNASLGARVTVRGPQVPHVPQVEVPQETPQVVPLPQAAVPEPQAAVPEAAPQLTIAELTVPVAAEPAGANSRWAP